MTAAPIQRVAVLGAGVMGRQIAALLANAGVDVDLLDLADGDEAAGRARAAVEALPGMRPPPLYAAELCARIQPGSLDAPEEALGRADWVIEAVVEDLPAKQALLGRIEALVPEAACVTTNTSGLSIAALTGNRSQAFQRRFFGVHFFNPPRYMKLVEVIAGPASDAARVEALSAFVRQRLGKGVVPCRDTPNFIANRLGVFALMDALRRMADDGLTVDEVDAVTGSVLGRPRSATLRLCDLIGLDTLLHVAATAHEGLVDDPNRAVFEPPAAVRAMREAGRLGDKTQGGFYRKTAAGIEALDLASMAYGPRPRVAVDLPTRGALDDRLAAVLATADGDRLRRFARDHLLATLSYCAATAGQVAESLEDVDRALRWGFNWEAGPFEMIDAVGARRLADALAAGGQAVPDLLGRLAAGEPGRVYAQVDGARRVVSPDGTRLTAPRPAGPPTDAERLAAAATVTQCDTARLVDAGDGAAVLEFRGKLNVLGPGSLAFARQAALETVPHRGFQLLVLTGAGAHFSAGADLRYVLGLIDEGRWDELDGYLRLFQQATAAMRYAAVPVTVAARGLALGGGCEFCLSAAGRAVAGELRTGLVETKVGVVPGAGGCKEMVRRCGADVDRCLPTLLEGRMSDNAVQARSWGFLEAADDVRLDEDRLLDAAVARARQLAAGDWSPPIPQALPVAGADTLERWQAHLEEERGKDRISAHDAVVGQALVRVLCGGGADGTVTEDRLLELEREAFLQLCGTQATRDRIAHMLETGKPLRN